MNKIIQFVYIMLLGESGWKLIKKNGRIDWIDGDGDIVNCTTRFNPRKYIVDRFLEKYII